MSMFKTARDEGREAGYAQFYADLEKVAAKKKKGPSAAEKKMKVRAKALGGQEKAFDRSLRGSKQVGPKIKTGITTGAGKYYGAQRKAGRGMMASAGNVAKRIGAREMAYYKRLPLYRKGIHRGLAGGLAAVFFLRDSLTGADLGIDSFRIA